MKDLTLSGELEQGVEVEGTWHRSFTLRAPTVQDNIDAVDQVGTTNAIALSAAILARQLTRLGTLPAPVPLELITGMHPSDFNRLEAAAAELEGKRRAALAATPNGHKPALPCAAPA
ncbi:MAG: phage tail assembly protein [Rubrivivax sp.]|jgi:phage FluMu protein gp41|nr:phage tail assembly protein [Rubrivivax sp.]